MALGQDGRSDLSVEKIRPPGRNVTFPAIECSHELMAVDCPGSRAGHRQTASVGLVVQVAVMKLGDRRIVLLGTRVECSLSHAGMMVRALPGDALLGIWINQVVLGNLVNRVLEVQAQILDRLEFHHWLHRMRLGGLRGQRGCLGLLRRVQRVIVPQMLQWLVNVFIEWRLAEFEDL